MRGIAFCAILLVGLAITDAYFSSQLLASAKIESLTHSHMRMDAIHGLASNFADATTLATAEVDMVEQALNSRYMQWGAVGVMLGLFVWVITRHLPNQEKRRDAERVAERQAYTQERAKERQAFLTAIENRDKMYLGTLAEIRRSVEAHAASNQAAKETLSNSVHELALEIRESMK